jgi:hypothetical protein
MHLERVARLGLRAADGTRVPETARKVARLHVVARIAPRHMTEEAAQLAHILPGGGVARYELVQIRGAAWEKQRRKKICNLLGLQYRYLVF